MKGWGKDGLGDGRIGGRMGWGKDGLGEGGVGGWVGGQMDRGEKGLGE